MPRLNEDGIAQVQRTATLLRKDARTSTGRPLVRGVVTGKFGRRMLRRHGLRRGVSAVTASLARA